MSRERIICGVIAVLCHAALLFGFRVGSLPVPLPMSDEPVEVSLVAAEPAPAPVVPEVAPAPPPPPPPAPVPEPITEPPPKPHPAPPEPHREPPKPQRPAVPVPRKAAPEATAPGTAPADTGSTGGARGNSIARPRFNPKPPYPPEARHLRQEGRVLLVVAVGADGRAANVSVARSSGVASLDQSAEAAVRRWTFEPARVAGLAVPSRVEVPVTFTFSN